ncbi:cytochrome P450 [Gymnopilus junonius]|uniref:Cytochrome P450 n=1 Tax=Gymnopilus junonius TaxID=109634 RepID=A0A9P5NZM3_GYMJU|nr:cytochrome P450 [Gymnopilus junonius]
MNLQEACFLGALVGLGLVVDMLVRRRNRQPAPPGPPGLPIIGNLRDMPTESSWEKYHAWCKEYNSDIIELNVLGRPLVILDTIEAVNELLDKRSAIYSNRPRMPMVTELMGWDFNIGTMPYGSTILSLTRHPTVLQAVVPGKYLVDTFPILKHVPDWMPFATFKKVARENSGVEQEDGGAGSDNTVATLAGFVFAMLSNPEAQAQAQSEIDSVIPNGDLPTFEDKDSLPYVTALVMEVFRCSISSPIGGPHVLQEDDVYKRYRLKAGSIVFANIWAIFHDEVTYPHPFSFKPERFLKGGKLNPVQEIYTVFGFGRRICPGRYMAFSTIWIAVASMLATFNISKVVDKDGRAIEPVLKYGNSSSCLPAPFECAITPRRPDVERTIVMASTVN